MIIYFDTETTGLKDPDVVELASVIVTDSGETYTFRELMKPSTPIEQGAENIHGISNEDVMDCRDSSVVTNEWFNDIKELAEQTGEQVIFCAHNLMFDKKVVQNHVSLQGYKSFCTLKLAKQLSKGGRLLSDNNKLETLYNYFGFIEKHNAHSALDDCRMLQAVASELLKLFSPFHTYYDEANSQCTYQVLTTVDFGKHKGKRFDELEKDYLQFIYDKFDDGDKRHTAGVLLGLTK
jgi:DNA polymerase III epsilon subunit-like protein